MTPAITFLKNHPDFIKFRNYVLTFYAYDGIYPVEGLTVAMVEGAIAEYLDICVNPNRHESWGLGDSLDRERVRDLMTDPIHRKVKVTPKRIDTSDKVIYVSVPQHSYLRVPYEQAEILGIVDKISAGSFHNTKYLWLDEKVDMQLFFDALDSLGLPEPNIYTETDKEGADTPFELYKKLHEESRI